MLTEKRPDGHRRHQHVSVEVQTALKGISLFPDAQLRKFNIIKNRKFPQQPGSVEGDRVALGTGPVKQISISQKIPACRYSSISHQKGIGYSQLNHVKERMLMRRNAAQAPFMPPV